MRKTPLSDLLAYRHFCRFWVARVAGTMANQMLMVAVAWQIYDVTSSAWDLGLVGLFQLIPALLMTLPAGHLVDRMHRGRIFAVCMLTLCGLALLLVVATRSGFVTRELPLGLSIILGVIRAFQMPAQQALIPLSVPQSLLPSAIALSASGMQAAVICGPALGGVLYVGGATMVYGSCAGFSLLAGLLNLTIKYEQRRSSEVATWRTVFANVNFVWHDKLLLGAISLDLFAVLLGGATALLPIYARYPACRSGGPGTVTFGAGGRCSAHVRSSHPLATTAAGRISTVGSGRGLRPGNAGTWIVVPV